jgi:hypothetical protein
MSALTAFEQDVVNIAKKAKSELEAVGEDAGKVLTWVATNGSQISGLAALAGPSGASIATIGLKLIGLAGAALQAEGEAASANQVSIPLDTTVKNDILALFAAVKSI